uniref:Glycosyl hydrolase family 13 catalytic domain-containing protein n=1 Tax=Meloidogyne enterolobii TaxID=390850 RepID=A0A6V7WRW9_MELEN|nr:unnamed protein product [Meloidogyne enterolobii]
MKDGGISTTKSDSYIFAIENNSIPICFDPLAGEDGRKLLFIPKTRRRGPLNIDEINECRYDPKWKIKRCFFYSIFWFGWIFSLLIAILITFSHPKCEFTTREWWKDSMIYEIWTLSFSDSNSDKIGDLIGIIQKLDYLRRLGVGAIFLRPIMRVEKSGLGVIEYNKLASKIGNFEQFNELIIKAHKKGIRVLIDFPLVLTSISNPWFDKSALASAHPEDAHFADFFIWRRGIPNSEFISEYCGSTLKYFHVKDRPDLPVLHWTNKNVSDTIKAALKFWINKGVDGFHFSSIEYLYRSEDGKNPNWEKIAKILRSLRIFLDDERGGGNAREKIFLFASHAHLSEASKRLLIEHASLNLIVNTELQSLASGNLICSSKNKGNNIGECANEIIADLLIFHKNDEEMSATGLVEKDEDRVKVWPVWNFGNAFTPRLAFRVGSRIIAEILIQLILILPGTPLLYYGEEIGQKDLSRGKFPQRGPLGWNIDEIEEENPHFSSTNNTNITTTSSPSLNKPKANQISQNIFRNFLRLSNLRKYSNSLRYGNVYITKPMEHDAFLLCRYIENNRENDRKFYGEVTIFAANFGSITRILPLSQLFPLFQQNSKNQKWHGRVIANSINALEDYPINSFLDLTRKKLIRLGPMQAIVIQAFNGYF